MKNWFNAKLTGPKVATVRIFDHLGTDFFGHNGTTARAFRDQVDALGKDLETLHVHINSPGGNVFDGLAVYNYLVRHRAQVVVHIDGIAASIASVIAMAGSRIVMPANAAMFIHNPLTFAGGDAAAFRKTADELDVIRHTIVSAYKSRVTIDREEVERLMDAETLLTAEQAVKWGFADEIEEASRMAASVNVSGSLAAARRRAELEAQNIGLRAQITALEAKRATLTRQLADRQRAARHTLEPMAPAAVIAAAAEAKSPEWLATHCLRQKYPAALVERAIADHAGIRAACARVGLPVAVADAAARDNMGNLPALVSALLVEALCLADDGSEISNRRPVDYLPENGVSVSGTYARRKAPAA